MSNRRKLKIRKPKNKRWAGRHSYHALQTNPDDPKHPVTIIRHFTQQDLDVKRHRNRRKNKTARAQRKANR